MTQPIRRVGVIGAGVMGSGIAAHFANAGCEVVLLDIVPRDLDKEVDPAKVSVLFDQAKAAIAGVGDGRISEDDAKKLLAILKKDSVYSDVEKKVLAKLRADFKWTDSADAFFRKEIRTWAAVRGSRKKTDPRRDQYAANGVKAALKAKPTPLFFHKSGADLVSVGNLEDDLDMLASVDLVVEAIIENLKIKQGLFTTLEKTLKPGTVVASNTSGLRIEDMLEGRSEEFKKNFLVMHFFNPVRHMKLLELVRGPETSDATCDRIESFGRDALGKGIVWGKDTPNFVGNRIGCHSMMLTMHTMLEMGLTPEDVDAITGTPMGHPRSASFRTADMVGLDTFHHVTSNCYAALTDDEERDVFKAPAFLDAMVEKKILGNKTKGGFYKRTRQGVMTLDLETLEYRPKGGDQALKAAMKGIRGPAAVRVKKLVATEGVAGEFAWKVLSRGMAYSARRIGEIADDVESCDNAMKWGYNWELGPFETWDALGFKETAERMKKDGLALPASIDTMLSKGATGFYDGDKMWDLAKGEYVARKIDKRNAPLAIIRKGESAVLSNGSAEAWDLGDGVLGLTFTSKANSIDDAIIEMIPQAIEKAEREFEGLLIFNEGKDFCVGANLFGVLMGAKGGNWEALDNMIRGFQGMVQLMKRSRVPVVAAPYGFTFGGGLEVCLGADDVQCAAETYAGLVEMGVGLVPGGGGHVNMLWRLLEGKPDGLMVDNQVYVARAFQNIADPVNGVSKSGPDAKARRYFLPSAGVSFDRARHLHEAKQKVIGMAAAGYTPKPSRAYVLPGASGIATIEVQVDSLVAGGFASPHDKKIAMKIATILCGGPSGHTHKVTEQEMLDIERESFLSLCGEPLSQDRMMHMLEKNKPLRN